MLYALTIVMTGNHEDQSRTEDLLSTIEIVVSCNICQSTYSVPASIVRDSQRILDEGCTGVSPYECDASFYATLIEPKVVAELERAWASFQRSAASHGGAGLHLRRGDADQREADVDADAVQRWENEGGRCEHVRAEQAERRARTDAKSADPT